VKKKGSRKERKKEGKKERRKERGKEGTKGRKGRRLNEVMECQKVFSCKEMNHTILMLITGLREKGIKNR
jgi:hypothetical protein